MTTNTPIEVENEMLKKQVDELQFKIAAFEATQKQKELDARIESFPATIGVVRSMIMDALSGLHLDSEEHPHYTRITLGTPDRELSQIEIENSYSHRNYSHRNLEPGDFEY